MQMGGRSQKGGERGRGGWLDLQTSQTHMARAGKQGVSAGDEADRKQGERREGEGGGGGGLRRARPT